MKKICTFIPYMGAQCSIVITFTRYVLDGSVSNPGMVELFRARPHLFPRSAHTHVRRMSGLLRR